MPLMKLTWNTHYSSVFSLLSSFLADETLVDVTLAAEGKFLKAHRLILCACSQFFQELISGLDKDKQPVIFLRGVKFAHLQLLMGFVYSGEVQVPAEELQELLKVAEELKIRGILDYHHSDSDNNVAVALPPSTATASSSSSTSHHPRLPITVLPRMATGAAAPGGARKWSRFRIGPKSKIRRYNSTPTAVKAHPIQQNEAPAPPQAPRDPIGDGLEALGVEEPEEFEQYLANAEVKVEPIEGLGGGEGWSAEVDGVDGAAEGASNSNTGANSQNSSLVAGLQSHSCTSCGRLYTSGKSLWRHRKFSFCGQDVREVFCCVVCGKRFSRSDNLRRHALVAQHPQNVPNL